MSFPAATLALLEREGEVEIETRSARGTKHRVIIWIVVADGVPYVRSVRGERGRWFRELRATGEGAILARRARIEVRATPATDGASMAKVSEAFRRKYPRSPSTASMVRKQILDTTMRLEPR